MRDLSQSIVDLLGHLIRWFAGQSKQKLEAKIQAELLGPGVRAQQLKRKTARAVATWVIIYYADPKPFNIEIGLDTLMYIENVPMIRRQNKLSTHAVSIVKQGYHSYVPSGSTARQSIQKVLLNQEATLQLIYSTHLIDEAWGIFHDLARLLTASEVDGAYFRRHHPSIDQRDKRVIETMIAMKIDNLRMQKLVPRLRVSDRSLIEEMLIDPAVPKSLLYPPDKIETEAAWRELITMAARRRLNSPNHIVFPPPGVVWRCGGG